MGESRPGILSKLMPRLCVGASSQSVSHSVSAILDLLKITIRGDMILEDVPRHNLVCGSRTMQMESSVQQRITDMRNRLSPPPSMLPPSPPPRMGHTPAMQRGGLLLESLVLNNFDRNNILIKFAMASNSLHCSFYQSSCLI